MDLGKTYCQRIKIDKAFELGNIKYFNDSVVGDVPVDYKACGDVVVVRKDTPASYHLACVVDDYLQGDY